MAHTVSILMLFTPLLVVILWFLWLYISEQLKSGDTGQLKYRERRVDTEQLLKVSSCRQKYSPPQTEPSIEAIISSARSRQ